MIPWNAEKLYERKREKMRNLWKRSLSLVLAFVMVLGFFPVSALAVSKADEFKNADGILWLYNENDSASEEFLSLVQAFKLDNLIRKSVGADENDDTIKVTYDGADIGSLVGLLACQASLTDEVKSVLKSHEHIAFEVNGVTKWIAVRTIQGVAVTVENIVISGEGAPADLDAQIAAVQSNLNKYITIEHNGVADLNKTRHTAAYSANEYHWPVAGEGDVVAGTITVTVNADDKGEAVGTAQVILRDTRTVLENRYDFSTPYQEGNVEVLSYYEGEEAPAAPALPTDTYYNCDAWELNEDSIYVPNWSPKVDNDGNGVADQLQTYTVTYIDGDIKDVHENIKYNADTPASRITAENPDPDNAALRFAGWVDKDGKAPAQKVVANAEYFPKWTQDPIVTYVVYRDNAVWNSFDLPTEKHDDGKFYAMDPGYGPEQYYIWQQWVDLETGDVYDFAQPVTANEITLVCVYYSNRNENDYVDGTAEDPYHVYEYYVRTAEGVDVKHITEDGILATDNFVAEDYAYPGTLKTGEKFMGWTVSDPVDSNEGGTKTYTCKPVIILDTNDNNIDDSQEMDTVSFAGIGGMATSYEDGKIKVTNGDYIGWVEITGLMYNENTDTYTFTYNPASTVVKVSPLWKNGEVLSEMAYYVASVEIAGETFSTYDENYNLVCAPVTEVKGVALTAATNVSVNINYAESVKLVGQGPACDLVPGKDLYTVEEVYAAAVASPAYADVASAITVQYKVRNAGTIKIPLDELKEELVAGGLGSLVDMAESMDVLPDTYSVTVSEKYADISNPAEYRAAKDVAGEFFDAILENVFLADGTVNYDYINTLDFKAELAALEQKIEDSAELHTFGQVAVGETGVDEVVDVTYKTEGQYANLRVALRIADDRPESNIRVLDKELEYDFGAFTNVDLLKNVVLENTSGQAISGNLTLDADYTIKRAKADGYTVTVTFGGNADYKGSTATFKLIVNKVTPVIIVPELIATMNGLTYDPAPKVTPAGIDAIHVIAGIEANELAIDPDELINNQELKLADDEVEIKVWMKLPALYIQSMNDMGVKLGTFEDLETIEDLLGKDVDNAIREKVNEIIRKILNNLPEMVQNTLGMEDVSVTLKLRIDAFGEKAYPTNAGIYMNLAANLPGIAKLVGMAGQSIPSDYAAFLDDANYNAAYSYGFIAISPLLTIPNDNGVQLFCEDAENAQNVFVFENGEAQPLEVRVGDTILTGEKPFYYGLSTNLSIVTEAPTKPGLYIAGYNYTDYVLNEVTGENELKRLGSDLALIIIKQTPVSLTVNGETVKYDGNAHLPTFTVVDDKNNEINDAAMTVISGSVNTSEATSIEDLHANVNIDFPAALDAKWESYWESKGKAAPQTATPNDVVAFLQFCRDTVVNNTSEALDLMEGLGIPSGFVDVDIETKVENGIDAAAATLQNLLDRATFHFDTLMVEVKKIGSKFDDEVSLTIKDLDELNYTGTGYYLFAAVVTDPEYTPAIGAGLLTIESSNTYEMHDTHVPYDGMPHSIEIVDDGDRDDVIVIVDDNGSNTKVTFDLDDTMTEALKVLLEKAGYTLNDGSDGFVGTAYTKGEAKLTAYLDEFETKFENWAKDKLIAKVTAKVNALYPKGGKELEDALNKALDEALAAFEPSEMVDALSQKLQDLDKLDNDTLVIINGEYPVEIGEYQFYGYNYDVAKASGTLYIEPAEEEEEYQDAYYKTLYQIRLIEPWALRINVRVTDEEYNTIDYSTVKDFGVYAIRRGQLADPEADIAEMTIEKLKAEANVIHFTKEDGTAVQSGQYITVSFFEGLYTYRLKQDVIWVLYYETDDGLFVTEVNERNLFDLMDERKDSTSATYSAQEKQVYADMVELYHKITDYRSDFDNLKDMVLQDTDTLATTNIAFASASTDGKYGFARVQQIGLIEPWGMRLNTRIFTPDNAAGAVDYSTLTDYGVIVYHDKANAETLTNADEFLNFANKDKTFVFSASQGTTTITNPYVTSTFNDSIYTYELDSTLYYMFFAQDGDNFYYSQVYATNIKDLAADRAVSSSATYTEKEKLTYAAMVELCESVTEYREWYFANTNK